MSGYTLLSGVRVLEVAQFAPSALGGILADLGAEVLKIEPPGGGDPVRRMGEWALGSADGPSFNHVRWNRGKASVSLDIRSERGRQLFLELARTTDIVVEGQRAGALSRIGLGPDELRAVNPRIVFCTLSGLGASGPYAKLGSHGHLYDAMAGLLGPEPDETGVPRRPKKRPVEVGIHASGVHAAVGVLAALFNARVTGEGTTIEVAASDASASWLPGEVETILNRDVIHSRGTHLPDGRLKGWPRTEFYAAADGRVMFFQAMEDRFWQNFCRVTERPDLLAIESDEKLYDALVAVFRQRPRAEWIALFRTEDVAGGPVNTLEELAEDEHFLARSNVYDVTAPNGAHLRLLATPIRVEGQGFSPSYPPEVGADTGRVLSEVLGLGADEIDDLRTDGVI